MDSDSRPELHSWRERRDRTLDEYRSAARDKRHSKGYRTARENVADLTDEAAILGARIDELHASTSVDGGESDPRIVSLTAARKARRIGLLKMDQQAVLDERATKEALIELIDTDIRDFENRLIEVRRAYTIHRVSS